MKERLGPSPVERLDEFSPLRMLGDQEFDGLGRGSPRVLVRVPPRRGHLGEERLHLVTVIVGTEVFLGDGLVEVHVGRGIWQTVAA